MIKYELIPAQLLHEGTITQENLFAPTPVGDSEILLTHDKLYWEKLCQQKLSAKEIRKIGFPMRPSLVERGRHIAGGTIECANYAMKYGVSLNIAGGTHHSFADHGEGFCILNDIAIASNFLLREKLVEQILVVDLDVHQGNGTAKIFENNANVFTFSMHGEKNYPTKKELSDLDIAMPDGCKDAPYLTKLREILPMLIKQVNPDIIFYLSGVDILATDKLGRLGMTREGCLKRDEFVFAQCSTHNIPVAVSMGGGYSEEIKDIVEAHANTFRAADSIFF